jgi:deoxyribonuclease IV
MGAECMQIFLSAPQRWQAPKHSDEQIDAYRRLLDEAHIAPNFAHATYLVNLASGDPVMRQKSIESVSASIQWADRVGLLGLVVHVGSGRGQPVEEAEQQVVTALQEVLARGGTTMVLLENSAGSGECLGSRFQQIGNIFDRLGRDPRLGLCMDTAHTFASGYDLREHDGIQRALEEIDRHISLDRLKLIHANDSKVGLNSAVDRHENIGKGMLGESAFVKMLAHPALREVAWVLEVPGYEDKGPDKPNLDDLKRLAHGG